MFKEIAKHLCLNNCWMNLAIVIVCAMIYKKIYSDVNKNRSVLVAKICLDSYGRIYDMVFVVVLWHQYICKTEPVIIF